MQFRCLKSGIHKFDLAKPAEIEGIWHWKGKVHCPYCGSAELEEILNVGAATVDLQKARRENREATMAAQAAAGQARRRELQERPEISLAPIQGSGRFGGDTIRVKKDLFEKLRQSTPDNAKTREGGDITPA